MNDYSQGYRNNSYNHYRDNSHRTGHYPQGYYYGGGHGFRGIDPRDQNGYHTHSNGNGNGNRNGKGFSLENGTVRVVTLGSILSFCILLFWELSGLRTEYVVEQKTVKLALEKIQDQVNQIKGDVVGHQGERFRRRDMAEWCSVLTTVNPEIKIRCPDPYELSGYKQFK